MEKITKSRAIELLEKGIFPKCEVSREVFKIIHSLKDLEYLESLSSVQGFVLYGYTDKEIEDYHIPEESVKVDIDEAYQILDGTSLIGAKLIGENNQVLLSNANDLNSFLRKHSSENFLLYWLD